MRTYKEVKIDGKAYIEFIEGEKLGWIPLDKGNSDYQRYLRWLENPDADEAQSL